MLRSLLRLCRRVLPRAGLPLLDHEGVGMGDGTYAWINVKTLQGEAGASPESLLMALITDWRYRDTYVTADSHKDDSKTIHGPYLVAAISVDSFERVSSDQAEDIVRAYALEYEIPQGEMKDLRRIVLEPVRTATAVFRLRDLGEPAMYELGYLLDEFIELVALDERAGIVTLIVMGED